MDGAKESYQIVIGGETGTGRAHLREMQVAATLGGKYACNSYHGSGPAISRSTRLDEANLTFLDVGRATSFENECFAGFP